MKELLQKLGIAAWIIIDALTFVFLMVKDWPDISWWNWIIIVPINIFLSTIWPIYWLILWPIFGQ